METFLQVRAEVPVVVSLVFGLGLLLRLAAVGHGASLGLVLGLVLLGLGLVWEAEVLVAVGLVLGLGLLLHLAELGHGAGLVLVLVLSSSVSAWYGRPRFSSPSAW